MAQRHKTFCRVCTAFCPTEVEIADGKPVRVTGDRSYALYGGYTCVKGRNLPSSHLDPNRILHSMKRGADGKHAKIGTDQALDEIAEKLTGIVQKYGPRSVAIYLGQPIAAYPATAHLAVAFMTALGSPMLFSTATIDQPGLNIANALHGEWEGGRPASWDADLFLMVGANPVISKQYLSQNPARKLKDGVNGGAKLIVIDPRSTETARRAHVHLQLRPGEDVAVLAGLVHILIKEAAIDHEFIRDNVDGLEHLTDAVKAFTPEYVARRAGINQADLLEAAKLLSESRRGYFGGGTGIGMGGRGNACFYLLLCLQSLRGAWPGEGEKSTNSAVLRPEIIFRAQPRGPYPPLFNEEMRVRGLKRSVAGMPSGALLDEILTPGEGKVRALFCLANPMLSMPDAKRTAEAFANLDLVVTPNVEMSATSLASDYVIATKHILETPSATHFMEGAKSVHVGYGWEVPHAQYTPALLDAPEGSDLVEDAHIFYRLAQKMGLELSFSSGSGFDMGASDEPAEPLDMSREPTTEELFDIHCHGSVVPLDRVRQHDGPRIYEEAQKYILPRDPACTARLDIGNSLIMDELAEIAKQQDVSVDPEFPYHLIPRRADHVIGSTLRAVPGIHKILYNPAFMHPSDLENLQLTDGALVEIRSQHGAVSAIAAGDLSLRPGVLSISHSYGPGPGEPNDPHRVGTNINHLLRLDMDFDPISGTPKMAAIPVSVVAI